MQNQIDPLIPSRKAAEMLGIAPQTLRAWRMRGCSPEYVRMANHVYYRRSVIDAFIDVNTHANTSEEVAREAA